MASWLKVAEDLFEVVDRRAKLVATEFSDEQSDSQSPASNAQEIQAKISKSKDKSWSRPSSIESSKITITERDQKDVTTLVTHKSAEKDQSLPSDNLVDTPTDLTMETSFSNSRDTVGDKPNPSIISTGITSATTEEVGSNNTREASVIEPITSAPKMVDTNIGKIEHNIERPSSSLSNQVDSKSGDHPSNNKTKNLSINEDISSSMGEDQTESEGFEINCVDTNEKNGPDPIYEPSSTVEKLNKNANIASPMKIQDQLDEAQGLLKTTVSTGQSKEARLARVCAGLSSRLQECKSENAQLEELLIAERELSASYETHIKQLQKDLSTSKTEAATVETSMAGALAAKNSEIDALVNSMETMKRQASASEQKLSSLQADMDTVLRSRELTETRMLQALREELASTERRAEEERVAHNATKMAAVEREVELEHRAVEASNALARLQRSAEESTSRAMECEHKVALLEVECASLNQELQEMEARARRGQKKSSEEANQILHIQAWQEEVERARLAQRDAESKLTSLEAEMQKMRVEMAGMKRDAEHYSRHMQKMRVEMAGMKRDAEQYSRREHMELEKRYRELTDLLYHKQTQLETMASEKAAAEFQLEKEIRRHREDQVEVERSRVSRRASSTWEEDADLKSLEPLPLHHRHMAGARIQLEKAAKLLDSGAIRATRFLWRNKQTVFLLRKLLHQWASTILAYHEEFLPPSASKVCYEHLHLARHTPITASLLVSVVAVLIHSFKSVELHASFV